MVITQLIFSLVSIDRIIPSVRCYTPLSPTYSTAVAVSVQLPTFLSECSNSLVEMGFFNCKDGLEEAGTKGAAAAMAAIFFFSSRRRHTIFDCDWSSECALPI